VGLVSSWRKCDTCRKVRPITEFDGDATTCQVCLTAPVKKPRAAAAVTTRTTTPKAPRPVAEPAGPRPPRLGSVGSGDLEVRERRARRAAQEALAAQHAEEFAALLREARAAEGLRG
jgi:hypothetical protein